LPDTKGMSEEPAWVLLYYTPQCAQI